MRTANWLIDLVYRLVYKPSFTLHVANDNMDATNKTHTECTEKYNKVSLLLFVISLVFIVLLFVKIEVVNKKAEAIEAKLVNCIRQIDNEMKNKVQRMVEKYLQSNMITATMKSRDREHVILGKLFLITSKHHC